MTLTFSIDWLNYTTITIGPRTATQLPYPIEHQNFSSAMPAKGYNRAMQAESGAKVSWHLSRDDMGYHTQYTGTALNAYRELGITAKMIAIHHSMKGGKCTRVDLAVDLHDMGLLISDLAWRMKSGDPNVKVKSFSHIQSQDGGETLYLGSRQSEQFIRIYNKAAEQSVDKDWIRVELECKGSRANEVGARLAMQSEDEMAQLTRGLLKNMANFDNNVWQDVVGKMAISIAKAQSKEPDTAGWLLGAVAPAMARYIRESGDHGIIEQFLAIVDAFMVNR